MECEARRFHVNEDQFLAEVHAGELLVTTLCREALPLLRFATRVAGRLSRSPCPCGRVGVVVEPGERLDGRLRVNESPLYESQIAGSWLGPRPPGCRSGWKSKPRESWCRFR